MKGFQQAMQEYEMKISDPYGAECQFKITDKICPECDDILVIDNKDGVLFCLSCGYEENNNDR